MLGVEKAHITYSEDGRGHHVRIGEGIDVGVEDFVALEGQDPVRLTNVFHPSNTTLTVAPANAAHLSTFGIDWGREGQSGFSAPFSWSGLSGSGGRILRACGHGPGTGGFRHA